MLSRIAFAGNQLNLHASGITLGNPGLVCKSSNQATTPLRKLHRHSSTSLIVYIIIIHPFSPPSLPLVSSRTLFPFLLTTVFFAASEVGNITNLSAERNSRIQKTIVVFRRPPPYNVKSKFRQPWQKRLAERRFKRAWRTGPDAACVPL